MATTKRIPSIVGQGYCHRCLQPVNSRFPRTCPADRHRDCMPTARTLPEARRLREQL